MIMSGEPKFELVNQGKGMYKIKHKGTPNYVGSILTLPGHGKWYAKLSSAPLDIPELEEIVREMKNL